MFYTKNYKKLANKAQDNYPVYIVVHSAGGTLVNPMADTSNQKAQNVEDYHLSIGWEGLGYHYFIEKNGDLWQGRPETYHGAHTSTVNDISIGICLAGNFDATLPTELQVEALRKLLLELINRFNLKKENILPHRHFYNKKTCYGKLLTDEWAQMLATPKPVESAIDDKLASCLYEKEEAENTLMKIKKLLGWG